MARYEKLEKLSVAVLVIVMVILAVAPEARAASKYMTLHRFRRGVGGNAPSAGVIFDAAGNLYSTTVQGGANCRKEQGCGTVFKLTPNQDGSWTESVLYSFCSLANCADGYFPFDGVTFDPAGNLYGTTLSGGSGGRGTVFKLAPNSDGSWTESVLYSFCSLANCNDGSNPSAGLIFDAKENLYGTTTGGGVNGEGTAFELMPNPDGSWTENVLHSFKRLDGMEPSTGLIFDQAGNLYGATAVGGDQSCPGGCGVVFELTPNRDGSWTESVLYRFKGMYRSTPAASLIFDASGNLYGTTLTGGRYQSGSVFELTPQAGGGWKESVLHTFCSRPNCEDGFNPGGSLIFDAAGNLYGTTEFGGATGYGVVFKLVPNSKGGWSETVLHNFINLPGAIPSAGLISDTAGNLYGTTLGDGISTFGSVFEITP